MELLFALVLFAIPFIVWQAYRYLRGRNAGRVTSLASGLGLGLLILVAGAVLLAPPAEERLKMTNEKAASAGGSQVVEDGLDGTTLARGLGVSHRAMLEALSGEFISEDSSPVDGQPRRLATADNKMALLETIGDESDVSSATLIVFLPSDSPFVAFQNTAYGIAFTKSALPDWPDAAKWFSESVTNIAEGGTDEQETSHDGVTARVSIARELGMMTVSVKRE